MAGYEARPGKGEVRFRRPSRPPREVRIRDRAARDIDTLARFFAQRNRPPAHCYWCRHPLQWTDGHREACCARCGLVSERRAA